MIGHVGTRVGALVDGQLPPTEAERLWSHVLTCVSCREAVEREGWVKTQLAGLRYDVSRPAPSYLHAVLSEPNPQRDLGPNPVRVLAAPGHSPAARRNRVAVAVLGAGSVGAAMVGVLALTVPTQVPPLDRRGPATSLTGVPETQPTAVPVSATNGTASVPLSNDDAHIRPTTAGDPYPDWVRITK